MTSNQIVSEQTKTQQKEQDKDEVVKRFSFDRSFQEKIVQAMLIDHPWAVQFAEVVEVSYFTHRYLKLIVDRHLEYYNSYKEFPSMELLLTMLKDDLRGEKDEVLRDQVKTFLIRVSQNENLGDLPFVKEKALDFCKRAALQKALNESIDLIKSEKYEKIIEVVKSAIHAGNHHSPGLDLFDDVAARYSETFRKTIPTGIQELDQRKILNGGLGAGELGVVVAPTGCHAAGTKILMYDGSLKLVEDIKVGDKLMGPDSKPRVVLRLHRGKQQMYKISPAKGEDFEVNEDHILSLMKAGNKIGQPGTVVNISVKELLQKSETYKSTYKLWQPEIIHFENQTERLTVRPYTLGLMIGNSEQDNKNDDSEVRYSDFLEMCGKKSEDRHLPKVYKTSTVKDRYELLAGLIDSRGYYRNNHFIIPLKSKQLVEDITFIGRSLGFRVNLTHKNNKTCGGKSYCVNLSGHIEKIPTRFNKVKNKQKASLPRPILTSFRVKPTDIKDYFGFTVDKDNLYVMGNFTVTHNCGKSHFLVHVGAQALLRGKNVLHYTFELNERAMGIRYDSHIIDIPSLECYDAKEEIQKYYTENQDNLGRLKIKYYPTNSATCMTLRGHIEKLATQAFRPDVVIIDYAGIMRSSEHYDLLRMELKKVMEELRALATDLDVPVWTAIQSNKEGAQNEIVDLTNMAEGYGQAHVADFVVGLSRKSAQKATGFGNIFIAKNRAGIDGIKYQIHLDTSKSKLRILTDEDLNEYNNEFEDDELKIVRQKLAQIQQRKM